MLQFLWRTTSGLVNSVDVPMDGSCDMLYGILYIGVSKFDTIYAIYMGAI